MNPKITPEILSALEQHPDGPIRLEGETGALPVYVIRLEDIASLQELVDNRVRESLAEADADIAAGRIVEWNPEDITQRGHERFRQNDQS